MKKLIRLLIVCSALLAQLAPLSTPACAAQRGRISQDFLIAVSLVPGNWITDMEGDLEKISRIANVISVAAGRYRSFQEKKLRPTLDAAERHGLKVILCYYRIQDGNTSLEELAAKFGNHPAVIGFKVQDELGARGESPEQLLAFLREAKGAIRRHSDRPIMFDVIPWEFWMAGSKRYQEKYPGSANSAIDAYVEAGVVDWLIISVSERATSIGAVLPRAVSRWGDKVKIVVRTSASFKGPRYTRDGGSDPSLVRQRALDAYNHGAHGIYYYSWQHADYRLLNKDGSSNPLYEGMQDTFRGLRTNRK